MKYLSVCSGIEAASVAWHPLGWSPVAFSEIDAFPRAVLAHHYPDVPNWGDLTNFKAWPDVCDCVRSGSKRQGEGDGANLVRPHAATHQGSRSRGGDLPLGATCETCGGAIVDVLVGGTPCQSFSVAGLRAGLDDPRGNLMLVYLAIARRYRPRWLVWENVPGVMSSNDERDFGTLLGGLAECGYGFAYRVLDAQYFGLAQRRKRVFVVGHLGDWRRAAAVLFERASLSGHPEPRREAGQIAPTIPSRRTAGGGLGTDFDCDGGVIPILDGAKGRTDTRGSRDGFGLGDIGEAGEPGFTLQANHSHAVAHGMAVRRLTPRECERLQGFQDDYTLVPYRGKLAADGPRYKALGNSMAVPVMRWIGQRIALVDSIPTNEHSQAGEQSWT